MNLDTWIWFGIYLFLNERTEGKSIMGHRRSRKIVDAGVVGCTMGDGRILVVDLLELTQTCPLNRFAFFLEVPILSHHTSIAHCHSMRIPGCLAFIRVISSEKVAVWIEKTFSVSELRRAFFIACKRGVLFEIGSCEGQVRERNLKAEDVGGPWAATNIGGMHSHTIKRRCDINNESKLKSKPKRELKNPLCTSRYNLEKAPTFP